MPDESHGGGDREAQCRPARNVQREVSAHVDAGDADDRLEAGEPAKAGLRARPGGRGAAVPRGQAATRVATVAAAATFVLHAAREAIYLSPGHGLRDQT